MSLHKSAIDVDIKLMLLIDSDDDVNPLVDRDILDDNLFIDAVECVHHNNEIVSPGRCTDPGVVGLAQALVQHLC